MYSTLRSHLASIKVTVLRQGARRPTEDLKWIRIGVGGFKKN